MIALQGRHYVACVLVYVLLSLIAVRIAVQQASIGILRPEKISQTGNLWRMTTDGDFLISWSDTTLRAIARACKDQFATEDVVARGEDYWHGSDCEGCRICDEAEVI